jgi:hypothetical protein
MRASVMWGSISAGAVSALCALVMVAGCSSIEVGTDYDPDANFAALRTYAWLPEQDRLVGPNRIYDTLLDSRVRRAVDRGLAAKGYAKRTADDADFLVAYHAGIETKLNVRAVNASFGYGEGLWGNELGPGADVREYDEGTLMLDILNNEERMLVWRGSASVEVSDSDNPDKRTQRIDEAVKRMLERFPPS